MNKKICFFSGGLRNSGGTERVLTILANKLIEEKYDITILNFSGENKESYFYLDDRIKIINLFSKPINTLLYYPLIVLKIREILKKEKIDIFIDVEILLTFYSILATRKLNIKHISWEHFNFYFNLGVKRRDIARKIAAKYSDNIITLTEEDKKYFEKNLKIKNKIDYIYNPTPFENAKFLNQEKKNIAIAVGRLNYQKNFSELLYIWKEIEINNLDWELKIIGSGEEKEELIKLSKKLKLEKITFVEKTKNVEVFYKEAKLYLMTSIFEGLPMTLIEAQSYGIPIISYDCKTGPKDIIENNKNGYLIKMGDRNEFINCVINLMKNPKKIGEFSKESMIRSEKFKIKNIILKWKEVLKNKN